MPVMVLSLIVVLGVLIFVHELGHFLVAKAVGIQVLRFSLGFGRPLVAWQRGETEYWISWIPLGGYVKMTGLEDEGMAGELEGGKANVPIDPARAFDHKPLWARMAVILAGVTMNVLLAFAIYTGLGAISGVPARATTQVDTVLTNVLPPGSEALADLRRGDRIVRVNRDSVKSWDDVQEALLKSGPEARIQIAGRPQPITVRLPVDTAARVRLVSWGIMPYAPARIDDLLLKLWRSPGTTIDLTVVRDAEVVNLKVTPRPQTDEDSLSGRPRPFGFIGAEGDFPEIRQRLPVLTAVRFGALQTVRQLGAVVSNVKRLVLGKASMKEVGGPIMIAQVSGQAVQLGLDRFLLFIAFFSISLAVLNLLPIPVLDGGHAMFLVAEAILRRPLSPQLRMRLTQLGMLVVLAIMVVAIGNDVLRLFR